LISWEFGESLGWFGEILCGSEGFIQLTPILVQKLNFAKRNNKRIENE